MGQLSHRNEALILVAKTQLEPELLKISACEKKSINQENKSLHFNFFRVPLHSHKSFMSTPEMSAECSALGAGLK